MPNLANTHPNHTILNDIMEFDYCIRVHDDGRITGEPNVWAPEYHGDDDSFDSDKWENFTIGWTGQLGTPAIMHNSEYIGGNLAREILETPGVYVAVVVHWDCDPSDEDEDHLDQYGECPESHIEGWVIARLKDDV